MSDIKESGFGSLMGPKQDPGLPPCITPESGHTPHSPPGVLTAHTPLGELVNPAVTGHSLSEVTLWLSLHLLAKGKTDSASEPGTTRFGHSWLFAWVPMSPAPTPFL